MCDERSSSFLHGSSKSGNEISSDGLQSKFSSVFSAGMQGRRSSSTGRSTRLRQYVVSFGAHFFTDERTKENANWNGIPGKSLKEIRCIQDTDERCSFTFNLLTLAMQPGLRNLSRKARGYKAVFNGPVCGKTAWTLYLRSQKKFVVIKNCGKLNVCSCSRSS